MAEQVGRIKYPDAENNRLKEYQAAICIQAWYRGVRVRCYLRYLNYSAIQIQRFCRGYISRKFVREYVKHEVYMMKYNFYSAMATRIQKTWRAYYSRCHMFNFYRRKQYFQIVAAKNEAVRQDLAFVHCERESEVDHAKKVQYALWLDEFAYKHHYLVSTYVQPGVYNSPNQNPADQNDMERRLRSVKLVPIKKPRSRITQTDFFRGGTFESECVGCDIPDRKLQSLPCKQQGPFRDPYQVHMLRYRPFRPTIRLENSFYSVEEARQKMKLESDARRFTSDNFVLSTKVQREKYQPLLHTSSVYGEEPRFRETNRCNWLGKDFRIYLPPLTLSNGMN